MLLLQDSLNLFAELTDSSDDDMLDLISNGDLIYILVTKLGTHLDIIELLRPCIRTICNLSSSNNKFLIQKLVFSGVLNVFLGLVHNPHPDIIKEMLWGISNLAADSAETI